MRGGSAGGGDDVENVRSSTDIVRLIGEHLELRPQGREFIGLCPFHDDHKPSMYVVPHKQMYNCFSCGAGGDVFTFMMDYHRMSFREALEELARRAGIELSRGRARADGEASPRKRVGAVNEFAQVFFRAVLTHETHGAGARELIARRGIADEMVEAFAIGAAPDRWDGLLLKAAKSGVPVEDLLAAGLAKTRDSGSGHYDALRNRLVFPIHDQIGRVVGFGGRRIDDEDDPKYLNSPETALFDKSRTLFGLHLAHREIKRQGVAIVTEGYTDVIACHQAGFSNVVGTLGTSLTKARAGADDDAPGSLLGHVEILRRLCDTVVLLFDGDEAGQRAADRAAEAFFNESIDVKVATMSAYTDAKDPDELFARDDGVETFERVIDNAVDVLEHRFGRVRARVSGQGVSVVEQALKDELGVLGRLGLNRASPQRRDLVINQLCAVTGLSRDSIAEAVKGSAVPTRGAPTRESATPSKAAEPRTGADVVLACVLAEPKLWLGVAADDIERIIKGTSSSEGYEVARTIADLARESREPGLLTVLDRLRDREGAASLASAWAGWIERMTISLGEDAVEENFRSGLQRARTPSEPETGAGMSVIQRLAATQSAHHRDPTRLPRIGGASRTQNAPDDRPRNPGPSGTNRDPSTPKRVDQGE